MTAFRVESELVFDHEEGSEVAGDLATDLGDSWHVLHEPATDQWFVCREVE